MTTLLSLKPEFRDLDKKYAGLVFDCDGTLVDSMESHYLAWRRCLDPHGLELTKDRFYELGGVPTRDIVVLLASEQSIQVDPVLVSKAKDDGFLDFATSVKAVEEIAKIARYYHGRMPIAVATGSNRQVATDSLQQIGLLDRFEIIICAEDVSQAKPHPAPFALAAERLEVNPMQCLAFEDTDAGLASAKAAGMKLCDVRPYYKLKK